MTNKEVQEFNKKMIKDLKKLANEGKATIAQIALLGEMERNLKIAK